MYTLREYTGTQRKPQRSLIGKASYEQLFYPTTLERRCKYGGNSRSSLLQIKLLAVSNGSCLSVIWVIGYKNYFISVNL